MRPTLARPGARTFPPASCPPKVQAVWKRGCRYGTSFSHSLGKGPDLAMGVAVPVVAALVALGLRRVRHGITRKAE